MAGLLGGCFQPLYASRSITGGSAVVDQLRSVDVAPIKTTIGNLDGGLAVELRKLAGFTDQDIADVAGAVPKVTGRA